ncbi:MAG: sulfurtransferase FdhD [Lachnospiraceae bacterium]|nr:sulfurtransferase FdhD [Lachnospiraceae bacterium]
MVREHSLSVLVDGTLAFQCVCTRTGLRELVIGRLFTEGIILSADNIEEIRFNEYENEASVFLKGEANLFIGSRRKQLSKLLPVTEVRREWIFALAKEFSKETKLHHATQGTHSCFLGRKGAVLFSCEDIGRHNAVDKAVGYALVNEIPLGECMLFCSGRVPTDMVEKVAVSGIPVLMSKAVPTAESIALADAYGLTLICRAWPDQCEIFTDYVGITTTF